MAQLGKIFLSFFIGVAVVIGLIKFFGPVDGVNLFAFPLAGILSIFMTLRIMKANDVLRYGLIESAFLLALWAAFIFFAIAVLKFMYSFFFSPFFN